MTTEPSQFKELRELLNALCEETISESQMRRLEVIVCNDPAAEAYYVQYMDMVATISHLVGSTASRTVELEIGKSATDEPHEDSVTYREARDEGRLRPGPWVAAAVQARPRSWRSIVAIGGLAIALLLAVIVARPLDLAAVARFWSGSNDTTVSPKPDEGRRHATAKGGSVAEVGPVSDLTHESVAVLVQVADAQWSNEQRGMRVGDALAPGTLRLESGLARIDFYCGATVIVEGPAHVNVLTPEAMRCELGKLHAHVPSSAGSFTIETPRSKIVNAGPEFGVEVDAARVTDIVVFDGAVDLYVEDSDGSQGMRRTLRHGEALRYDAKGGAFELEQPPQFVSAAILADRLEAILKKRHSAWLDRARMYAEDPEVLAFFPFDEPPGWQRRLVNRAADQEETSDGLVVGCELVDGRWPWKSAMEFKRIGDRVRVDIPLDAESFTLAASLRVDGFPHRYSSLLMSDGFEEGEIHWQIGTSGEVALGVQGLGGEGGYTYRTGPILSRERLGQWIHLAVVYDRARGKVAHYLNGELVAEEPTVNDPKLRIGRAEIGNWNVASHQSGSPIRNLNGRLDEFIVYARALAAEEILELIMNAAMY